MVLPSGLIASSVGLDVIVTLKRGSIIAGKLKSYDSHMNFVIGTATKTSDDGLQVCNVDAIYVRGVSIKYIRFPRECVELSKKKEIEQMKSKGPHSVKRKNPSYQKQSQNQPAVESTAVGHTYRQKQGVEKRNSEKPGRNMTRSDSTKPKSSTSNDTKNAVPNRRPYRPRNNTQTS